MYGYLESIMWIDRQSKPKPWRMRLLAASLLTCGSVSLALVLRWPGFLWFAIPVVVPAVLLTHSLVYVRIRAMLLVFGAIIAYLIVQALAPIAQFQPQMLGRLDIVCPMLLAIGAVATLHAYTPMVILLIVGTSYALSVLSGLAGMALGDYRHFVVLTGAYTILLTMFLYVSRRSASIVRLSGKQRLLHAGLVAFALLVSGILLPLVRDGAFALYGRMMSASAFMMHSPATLRAGRFLDLHQMVPKDFRKRSAVLLRVESSELPGYLRGNCYATYQNGRWVPESESFRITAQAANGKMRTFVLNDSRVSDDVDMRGAMTVHRAPGFLSHVLHLPAMTDEVIMPVSSLKRDAHGTVLPGTQSRKVCRFYMLTRSNTGLLTADQTSSNTISPACFEVPEALQADLQSIAEPIFSDIASSGTVDKLRALAAFFGSHFSYELGVTMQRDSDPILQFLKDERRGHCSFFAAGTALLLRTQGIATRVISGFVCVERHPSGDYWVARERTAHAWVEAYIPESGRWVLVDNTPADDRPNGDSQFGHASALMDRFRFWRQRMVTLLQQLSPRELMAFVGKQMYVWICLLFGSAWKSMLIVMLLAACAILFWLKQRRPALHFLAATSSATCLFELDRLLRQLGIRRHLGQTVRRAIVEASDIDPILHVEVRRAVTCYEELRYQPGGATQASAQALKVDISQLRKIVREQG